MFCEKCGTKIEDGQPFCPNCGNRLADPVAPAAPAQPEAPAAPAAPVNPEMNNIPAGSYAAPAAPVNPGLNNIPAGTYAAPAAAAVKAPAAPKKPLKLPALGGLTDKFNSMEGLGQIFYGCIGVLLVVCTVLSLLKVYANSGVAFSLGFGPTWLFFISTVLFTLCINFYLMDALGKFSFKWLWLFIAGSAALILLLFIIVWIAGVTLMGYTASVHLTVGGWFFLLFQAGLTAVSILYLLEQKKK